MQLLKELRLELWILRRHWDYRKCGEGCLKEGILGVLMIVPVIIFLSVFLLIPTFFDIIGSFYYVHTLAGFQQYVGLTNYVNVINDDRFGVSIIRNLLYTLLSTSIVTGLGFIASLSLNEEFRGRGILRSLFIVSFALPSICAAIMWRFLFFTDYTGLFNAILRLIGVKEPVNFMGAATAWLVTLVIIIWRLFPLMFVITMAGLVSIPKVYWDAAKVEGMSPFQTYIKVILPQMKGGILFGIILLLIFSWGRFDEPFLMGIMGPITYVMNLPVLAYIYAYYDLNLGQALAVSTIEVIPILILIIYLLRRFKL
jgi:ABC-type sugar transport system permease subunit